MGLEPYEITDENNEEKETSWSDIEYLSDANNNTDGGLQKLLWPGYRQSL